MSPLFWGTKKWDPDLTGLQLPNHQACFNFVFNFKHNSEQLELHMDITSFPVSCEQIIKLGIRSGQRDPFWGESKVARNTSPSLLFFLCVCVRAFV